MTHHGGVRGRSRVGAAVLVALVLVAAVLLGGARRSHGTETRVARCERYQQTADAVESRVPAAEAALVVIGDSWSVGLGLEDRSAAWPSRLPSSTRVAGFSGSGYGALASSCGAVSFADRAPEALRDTAPGVPVIVEGGLNDWDSTDAEITAGFHNLMRELRGHEVLVAGPPAAPARAAFMGRVSSLLADLCHRAGVRYLPTDDLDLIYQPDGLHPSPAGAAVFGDAVAAALD